MTSGGLAFEVLVGTGAVFLGLSVIAIARVHRGPTIQDRVLGINLIGTNTVVVLVVISVTVGHRIVLDLAILYALLNFVLSVAIARFVSRGWV